MRSIEGIVKIINRFEFQNLYSATYQKIILFFSVGNQSFCNFLFFEWICLFRAQTMPERGITIKLSNFYYASQSAVSAIADDVPRIFCMGGMV
jgi:hypothetical protein